jgi:ribosomal protein S18 acetylase RimI-like enzyme
MVRRGNICDLDDLAGLFNDYRVFYRQETNIEKAKEFLSDRLTKNESVVFVAFAGDTMAGFVQLYPVFSSVRMKKRWLLNDLFVKEEFRGQGFSIALIEQAKELCRQTGARGFVLETAKTNVIGNRLYQKLNLQLDTEYNTYSWDI